jgi:hypothetical protein
LVDEKNFNRDGKGSLRKEECSAQTKRQPVRGHMIHCDRYTYTTLAQDIVETLRETYKCSTLIAEDELGELKPPRSKDVNNGVVRQDGVKR